MAGDSVEDERLLIKRASERNHKAFEALYRRHVGRVYAVCLRMLADQAAAEDCTQEAFVQAWNKLPAFRGDSAFGTWMHQIAVNQVLMLRRRGNTAKRQLEAVGQDWAIDVAADPGQARPDRQMDLEQAVSRLPEGARDVFVLTVVNGFSHEEAAGQLGVAVGTCKAQLHRARRLLKEQLV